MSKVIHCPCGYVVRGRDDDELVANAEKHVKEAHPGMKATREQYLAMAQPDPRAR